MTLLVNSYATAREAALANSYNTTVDGAPLATALPNSRSKRVKYWRKTDGWITTGPTVQSDPAEYAEYLSKKKFREIPDRFGNEQVGLGRIQQSHPGRTNRWLEPFFEAGGHTYICGEQDIAFGRPGEYLMPAEQIIAYGLHHDERMRRDRPDIADHQDVYCPYDCLDRDGGPRAFNYQKDLNQHIVAVHQDAVPSRATGNAIADAIAKMGGGGDMDYAKIAAVVAAVMDAREGKKPKSDEPTERYPEGEPDMTWKRPQLFAYIKDNDLGFPPGFMKWSLEEALAYVQDARASLVDDTEVNAEGV